MPEPLSIATGVISIVFNCIKGLDIAKSYINKYNEAELKLLSLHTSCITLHEALIQIQDLLLSDETRPSFRSDNSKPVTSAERFERVFGNCSVTFTILLAKVEPLLSPKFSAENEVTKRSKIASIWNESQIDLIIGLIDKLTPGVHLLFSAFQAKTTFETHKILTSYDAATIFDSIESDTQSLYTSHREQSLAQRTRIDGAESILGDEEFPELDDILVNSKVYRRVLASNLSRVTNVEASLPQDAPSESQPVVANPSNESSPSSNSTANAQQEPSRPSQSRITNGNNSFLAAIFKSKQSKSLNSLKRAASDAGAHRGQPRTDWSGSSSSATSEPPFVRGDFKTGRKRVSEDGRTAVVDPWDKVKLLVSVDREQQSSARSSEEINGKLDSQANSITELLRSGKSPVRISR